MAAVDAPFDKDFCFLNYLDDADQCQDSITVKRSAYWCYCGPLLSLSTDSNSSLPVNFYDFESHVFRGSILSRVIPFLSYIKNLLLANGFEHYFLTIRATTPTHEFDQPRWHTDELFFTKDVLPGTRLGLKSQHQKHVQNTGTDWKICTTLLGPQHYSYLHPINPPRAKHNSPPVTQQVQTMNACQFVVLAVQLQQMLCAMN